MATASEETATLSHRKHVQVWKTIGIIVAALIGAGTVAGSIGRAFYVTRDEYTEASRRDAVEKANIGKTLESLNQTMSQQRAALDDLSEAANDIKTDVAVIKARTSRRR